MSLLTTALGPKRLALVRELLPKPRTIAFVVTAIPSYLLTKVIGKHLESVVIMGWSLLIGGIVMWIVAADGSPCECSEQT